MQQDDDWPEFGSGHYSVQADSVILKEKFFVLEINQHRNAPGTVDKNLLVGSWRAVPQIEAVPLGHKDWLLAPPDDNAMSALLNQVPNGGQGF